MNKLSAIKATSVEQNPTNANKEKERKGKKRKEKSIVDTNVSMSDAEHPTQERIDYKAIIIFLMKNERCIRQSDVSDK